MFNEIGLVSIRRLLAAISGKYPQSLHFHTKRWHCGSVTEHVSEISLQHDRGCRLLLMHGYKKIGNNLHKLEYNPCLVAHPT